MATTTVNLLTALTAADSGDKIPIWDISAGQYKAITKTNLFGGTLALDALTFAHPLNTGAEQIKITTDRFPFLIGVEDTAIFNGVRDQTMQVGFNARSPGNDPAVYLQWEQWYQPSPTASQAEFMLIFKQPVALGNAYLRPLQINMMYDTDLVQQVFVSDLYAWGTRTGSNVMTLEKSTLNLTGITLSVATNNQIAVQQTGSGGIGGIPLLKLSAANVLEICQTALTTKIMGPLYTTAGQDLYLMGGGVGSYTDCVWLGHPSLFTTYRHVVTASVSSSGAGAGLNFDINTGTENVRNTTLALRGNKRVGVNDAAPDGTLHVQTADAAAVPVLLLEQLDVSEEMIEFTSTAGTGNAIEDVGTKLLTTTEYIKVTVNGAARYIAVGTIAAPP